MSLYGAWYYPVQFSYLIGFLQVIYSMADEYVPEYVDKKALVER
jgi:hypothetical protein